MDIVSVGSTWLEPSELRSAQRRLRSAKQTESRRQRVSGSGVGACAKVGLTVIQQSADRRGTISESDQQSGGSPILPSFRGKRGSGGLGGTRKLGKL